MKRLLEWIKGKLRRGPCIPEKVRQHIASVEELVTIHRSEIHDKENWNFKERVNDYIHKNILWKTGSVNGNEQISPISRFDVEKQKSNVLLQRVLWGEQQDAYFYGVMSFVKYKKKWYFVNSKIVQPLSKLPAFEECYANVETQDGKIEMATFSNMRELFYQYKEE